MTLATTASEVKVRFASDIDEKIEKALEELRSSRPGYFSYRKMEEYLQRLKDAIEFNKELIEIYFKFRYERSPQGKKALVICEEIPTPYTGKGVTAASSLVCIKFVSYKLLNEYIIDIDLVTPGYVGSKSIVEEGLRKGGYDYVIFKTDEIALKEGLKELIGKKFGGRKLVEELEKRYYRRVPTLLSRLF